MPARKRSSTDVAHLERALTDLNVVHVKTRLGSFGVAHARASRCVEHDAGIADLAAHLSVEGGDVEQHLYRIACGSGFDALAVAHDRDDLRLDGLLIVADERRGTELFQQVGVDAAVG